MQSGRYVNVHGGSPLTPYVYPSSANSNSGGSQSFAGQVRFNASIQSLEIFDGNVWQQYYNSIANVGLTPEAEQILDWASNKMREEAELEKLAKENATVNDLLQQVKEKQDQLKVVTTLLKSPETVS